MKTIAAAALLDCTLESPLGATRTKAILPFFTEDYETKWLLVVLDDDSLVVVKEKPTGLVSRALAFPRAPRLRKFKHVQVASLRGLAHYDPWWLLKDRKEDRWAALRGDAARRRGSAHGPQGRAAVAARGGAGVGDFEVGVVGQSGHLRHRGPCRRARRAHRPTAIAIRCPAAPLSVTL
jgi:hypothetical protein